MARRERQISWPERLAVRNERPYFFLVGKGEQTRDRIVNEAIRLASRDGFENLSIGALAAELRMSKSGLFA
ncbi:hypothetical protein, partial [Enterococcus casseliflavus]|uniref:hypothetical protein n=1 Tax=Enterococcus casseliflavus TaxID=37734 RepID=UPI003D0B4352